MAFKPTVGRIVHYQSHGSPDGTYKSECRPAIITSAPTSGGRGRPSKKIDLAVFNPTGMFFNSCVQDEDTKAGGTWHVPEMVEEDKPKVVVTSKIKPVAEVDDDEV